MKSVLRLLLWLSLIVCLRAQQVTPIYNGSMTGTLVFNVSSITGTGIWPVQNLGLGVYDSSHFLNGAGQFVTISAGGNVVGPPSSVSNDLAAFNGTSGVLLKDSGILLGNVVSVSGATSNQLAYYTGSGWAPLTLGTNLSITGATLNAGGGGGGGNMNSVGTPTAGQIGVWTSATQMQGLTTLPSSAFPTLTGDVTNSALATTVAKIQGVTVSGTTGTTNVVFSTSPTISGLTMTGVPVAPTAALSTNTTQVATCAFVIANAGNTYTFADSVLNTSGTVTLKGDSATPGNSKFYGTNGSGTNGWYAQSSITAGLTGGTNTQVIYFTGATTYGSSSGFTSDTSGNVSVVSLTVGSTGIASSSGQNLNLNPASTEALQSNAAVFNRYTASGMVGDYFYTTGAASTNFIVGWTGTQGIVETGAASSYISYIAYGHVFQIGGSVTVMVVNPTGTVTIGGATDDGTYKLQVQGAIRTNVTLNSGSLSAGHYFTMNVNGTSVNVLAQ